jgi:hypothetical protein
MLAEARQDPSTDSPVAVVHRLDARITELEASLAAAHLHLRRRH